MKTSATVAAGAAAATAAIADQGRAEVDAWKALEGSTVKFGDAHLKLLSVEVHDHSLDVARPSDVRRHSISLFFEEESGRPTLDSINIVRNAEGAHELVLSQVVAPQGKTGNFYEAVIG